MSTASKSSLVRLLTVSFVTGFSGAVMPGTLLVAVIQQSTVQGYKGMIGLITGHAMLEIVIVALLAMGLRAVLARPRVRGGIGLVGGAALIYMGVDMLLAVPHLSMSAQASNQSAYSWPMLFLYGAALCAANPYFTGWWATVGAGQLAHAAPRTFFEYLTFFVGHEASDYVWYAFVAFLVVNGRDYLLTDSIYRGLIAVCAVLIAALGLWFFLKDGQLVFRGNRQPKTAVDQPASG